MNGSSPSHPQPTISGGLPSELKQLIDLESKSIGDSTSDTKSMDENKTDDEKTSSLQMPVKNDAYTANREREASWYNPGEGATKPSYVEETFLVATAPTAQSSSASRMDGLFLKLDEDEGLLGNQTRYDDRVCPSVCLPVCLSLCQSVFKTRTGRDISYKRRPGTMMSASISVLSSIGLSVCVCVRPSVGRSICPFVCLSVYASIRQSVRPSNRLSFCLSVCLSASVSVCLYICICLSLLVCLSTDGCSVVPSSHIQRTFVE